MHEDKTHTAELIEALTERTELNEAQVKDAVRVVDEVLASEESPQPEPPAPASGELFADAIVKNDTGVLKLPKLRRRHERQPNPALKV
jgi:hypothetical protein